MRVTKSVFSTVLLMAQCLWCHCTCTFDAISCLGLTWSCSTPTAAVPASLAHLKLVLNNFPCLPIFLRSSNLKSLQLEIYNTKCGQHKKIWTDTHNLLGSLLGEWEGCTLLPLSVLKCFLSNCDSATILQWQTLGMTFFDTMSIVTSVIFDTRHIGVIWHRQLDSSGHWRSNA